MDKPETKANEEWTFAFVSGLSIFHLPLSLACPFLICLCLWLVHSSFAFVSGLSILHLPLSLACLFFICFCLCQEWTSQRQSQMMNGQARDKGK
jgi:F0F1-type ATP synthase assembly protein I